MEYPIDLPGGGQESTKTLCCGLEEDGEFTPVVACPKLLSSKTSDYPFRVVCFSSDENRELSKIRRLGNFFGRIVWFKRIIMYFSRSQEELYAWYSVEKLSYSTYPE